MSYKTLFADQLSEFLQQPDVVVLDHRDVRSYSSEHLPNAMLVNDALIMHLRKKREVPILVYCYHGNSSKDLCNLLINFGCENVYNLEGGWQAWAAFEQMQAPATISPTLSKWLDDYGFDPGNINSRIENGMSALMQAAYLAERAMVEELLLSGIDINLLNNDENNALWFACVSEDVEIIKLLAANGIDINHRNVNGATSLIYAASAGKFSVVQRLVEAGADIQSKTLDGFTALDSASTIEILKFLKPQYAAA